jgi:hypothetical protein
MDFIPSFSKYFIIYCSRFLKFLVFIEKTLFQRIIVFVEKLNKVYRYIYKFMFYEGKTNE